MPERWLGITVKSGEIVLVDVKVPDSGALILQGDHSWQLQEGPRGPAYGVLHQQVAEYVRENGIDRVVIKASAVSLGGTKLAHLQAAELRGVVLCAAATETRTETISKNYVSRTFGSRKVDEYVKDDNFWSSQIAGLKLRVQSREAAMILLAARKKK